MAAKHCVLFENDESVINDVKHSLKLIELEVKSAKTIEEIKSMLIEEQPLVIFAGARQDGDAEAGLRLAKNIKTHPGLQTIPLVLLKNKEEISHNSVSSEWYEAELALPVEFPKFTKEVRKLLEHFETNPVEAKEREVSKEELEPPKPAASAALTPAAPSAASPAEDKLATLDKRMVIAYGIQLTVLEALREHPEFSHASLQDIPAIISEVTSRVCSDLDIKELIGID